MSLAQLLQSYSQDIQAREQHNDEIGERNADAKANDMEAGFQHHLEALSNGAVDLGSAASAYHLGRKVYQKFKQGKDVVKKIDELRDAIKNRGQADPSGEEGRDVESQPGQEPHDGNQGSARGGDGTESDIQPRAGAEPNADDLDTRVSDVQDRFQALKQKVEAQRERLSAPQDEGTPSQNVRDAVREDTPSGDITAPKPEDAATESADAPASQTVNNVRQAEPTPQAQAEPTTQTGGRTELGTRNVEQPGNLESTLRPEPSDPFSGPRTLEQTGGRLGAEGPSAVGTEIESGINDADRSVGALSRAGAAVSDTVNGIKSSVGNMVKNVGAKVGGAVKSVLPESLGDIGTEAAVSAGLDAIPVVGEVASVVMGLVSLFEGIHHDDAPKKQPAPQVTPVTVGSGIDPTALTASAPAQATIV